MKVLSIKQPWADLIADGIKTIEVRSWTTHYRGPLLVVSTARAERNEYAQLWPEPERERNSIAVCVVELVDVRPGRPSDKRAAGGFDPSGYFSWVLANPRKVRPIAWKGALGLRDVEPRVVARLSC
jgi:activating signal cointegrator 1